MVAVFTWAALLPTADAQTMYKYVDKDGKVTYSDKPPRNGEKAETVAPVEKGANIVKLDNKGTQATAQKFSDVKGRTDQRVAARDKLEKAVNEAEDRLTRAKKALENGRDPKDGEQRIVVRAQGGNSVFRTEAYYARVAALEADVKKAEEALSLAQERYRRNAPD
jgi:hypothetical protein